MPEALETTAVCVFFDWQNCYRTARDAFGFKNGPGIPGNVKPLALAKMLAARRTDGTTGTLAGVRIYTGKASQKREQATYDANQRQFAAWEASDRDLVRIYSRTLDYSLGHPREKGIDVLLAVDLVKTTLIDKSHTVAIVVSADTDLVPALELVVEEVGADGLEVATWKGPHWSPQPLSVAGSRVKQHQMDRAFYERVKDTTDYTVAKPRYAPQGRRLPPRREGNQ